MFRSIDKKNWYDSLQYVVILLIAASIPVRWRLGLFTAILLVIATVLKNVAQHRIGNPCLNSSLRMALYAPIIYWIVLAISLLWSHDVAAGLNLLFRMAVLIIFPLCILLSDTSYLSINHLRSMGYSLLVATCGAFFYFIIEALIAIIQGTDFTTFYEDFYSHDRNGYRHHAYIAMYAICAMVFVYYELSSYWKEMKVWYRGLLLFSAIVLMSYIVLVNSRAGIVVMSIVFLACVLHLSITKRSWRIGLELTVFLIFGVVGTTKCIPTYTNRLYETMEDVEEDTRFSIYKCNWHAISNKPIVGYGIGDSRSIQEETYKKEDFISGAQADFNAHNQYLDSMLSAGVLGLLSLLLFLTAPVVIALSEHNRNRFLIYLLTGIVMMNLLFESMFDRQMGLLFISGLYAVMVLMMSVKNKKPEVRQI